MDEAGTVQDAELEQLRANINKTMAETMKIGAETAKVIAEQRYYPMIALGAIVVSALSAVAVLIAKLL